MTTKKSKKVLVDRKFLEDLTDALYWAIRTDWDQSPNADAEDDLIEQVEKKLGIKFPLSVESYPPIKTLQTRGHTVKPLRSDEDPDPHYKADDWGSHMQEFGFEPGDN